MSTEDGNDNLQDHGAAGAGEGAALDNTSNENDTNDGKGDNGGDNTPAAPELNEEVVITYLKTRSGGKEFNSIDDLFIEKTVEVDTNPYKDILEDGEAKSFLDFKKETGRGLSDYLKLQENINDKPVIELAIAKTELELGSGLTKEEIAEYIEEETGVDIDSIDELSELDKRKLNRFVKDYKDKMLAEQEKYRTPVAKQSPASEVETITLENGITVDKKVYDDHLNKVQAYQKDIKVAVDSVAKTSLSVEIENAGKKETLTFDYEYDADDKKEMLSLAEDLDKTVGKLFVTESGFNHSGLVEALLRFNPKSWEKMATAIAHKARAQAIEELTKVGNNVNLQQDIIQAGDAKPGTKIVPVSQLFNL
jgi:hypothetical protein